ncbi:MAG: hypothetical protein IJX78_07535 [Bacilli bacterium]|nr:hypothetical protein [Bacilli bacterium]
MFAKIISKDDREYYSCIFAKFNSGWDEVVIVFDDYNNKFELLNVYTTFPSIIRKVFIIDTDTSDWIHKDVIKLSLVNKYKECDGYDWLINNEELINAIKNDKEVAEEIKLKAKKLNDAIEINEWHYIKTPKDISDLLTAAWGFHDSYIIDIKYEKEVEFPLAPTIIQILFAGCWNCSILLEFERDVLVHFVSDDKTIDCFLGANIVFENGYVYWIGDTGDCIQNISDIKEYHTYFRARSLKWKMITNNKE